MAIRRPGIFITLEGTEGSGKSTLSQLLAHDLRGQGYLVTTTREPGGPKVSEELRRCVLNFEMHPWTETFIYQAARSEHVLHTILPALEAGHVVICDRFTDSTVAYQGYGRGLDLASVTKLNHIATHGIKPDCTFWLDLPVEVGLNRASDPNRFEKEAIQFHKKVRAGFLAAHKKNSKKFIRVAVHKSDPKQIAEKTLKHLMPLLRQVPQL
jgi:dTMP kinase